MGHLASGVIVRVGMLRLRRAALRSLDYAQHDNKNYLGFTNE
jgi:hypothetical protein